MEQEKCFLMKKNEEMAAQSEMAKDVEMLPAPPSVWPNGWEGEGRVSHRVKETWRARAWLRHRRGVLGALLGDSVFPMKNSKTQLTSGKKILWDFLSLANEYLLPLLGLLLAGYINVGNAESLLLMNWEMDNNLPAKMKGFF